MRIGNTHVFMSILIIGIEMTVDYYGFQWDDEKNKLNFKKAWNLF